MEQTHSKLNRPTLSQRFYENRFVWISFAASALVMLLVYICFELIPFGSRTILRMDLYHQYGPLFAELYERLVGGESLIYSWDTGLGSSFLGNFYNYLSSPLSVIILLFGHSNIPEAIATMILLKAPSPAPPLPIISSAPPAKTTRQSPPSACSIPSVAFSSLITGM